MHIHVQEQRDQHQHQGEKDCRHAHVHADVYVAHADALVPALHCARQVGFSSFSKLHLVENVHAGEGCHAGGCMLN